MAIETTVIHTRVKCLFSFLAGFLLLSVAVVTHAQSPNPFYQVDDPEAIRYLQKEELFIGGPLAKFEMRLPGDELLTFESIDVSVNAGVRTLKGSIAGGSILLTTDGTRGFGYVLIDGKYYVIDTVNNDPLIVEASSLPSPSLITKGWGNDFEINYDLILEQMSSVESGGISEQSVLALSIVDVAFFYDQALADSEGLQSPRTRAQAAVDFTNAAIAMHGVELELRLVYVGALATPLVGDPWSVFVTDTDKWTTASDFGADLLHYIYNFGDESYCGRGYLPGQVAVSAAECGSFTIAHELGHNMGLHHDRANGSDIGTPYSGYNYGYICGNSGTIMAYWSPRVPHYSTPLLQNGGENCGIEIGQPDAAYNGAVLDVTRDSTAAFTPDQTTIGSVSIATVGPIQVDENAGMPILVDVTRDGDLTQETSVEIGPIDLETLSGSDYQDFVERLVFAPGESTNQISINVIDDGAYEPIAESFDVVLRYPYKLEVVASPLTISIVSDDPDRGTAQFRDSYAAIWENIGTLIVNVDRVGATDFPLAVDYFIDASTAQPGIDYVDTSGPITFEIGESAKSISIDIINDDLFEGYIANTFFVRLTGDNVNLDGDEFPVYVWNDDLFLGQARFNSDSHYVLEDAGNVDIGIERINGAEGNHAVCVQFPNTGTAIAGADYSNAQQCNSIPNGETSTAVSISILDNIDADGEKYFDITLWSSNATVEPSSARVYILDDDATTQGGGWVEFAAANVIADEAAANVDVSVRRVSGSAGSALLNYATVAGTAVAGTDFIGQTGAIVWEDGDMADKIISIPVVNDRLIEADESFSIQITSSGGAALGGLLETTVSISSDDSAGTLSLSAANVSVSESGFVDVFINREDGDVGAVGVTAVVTSGTAVDDIDFYADGYYASWPDGDSTSRSIRITGIDDDVFELNETFSITLDAPCCGAVLGTASTLVTVTNDDIALPFAAIPDISGDGVADIAVSFQQPGSTRVHIRDGSTDALITDIDFGSDLAFDMAVLPDLDASGDPEIAILQQQPSGQVRVQARDSVTGGVTSNLWYGLQYEPVSMDIVIQRQWLPRSCRTGLGSRYRCGSSTSQRLGYGWFPR